MPGSTASRPCMALAGGWCRPGTRHDTRGQRHIDPAGGVGADRHGRAVRDGAGVAGLFDLRPDGRRPGQ
ncbi:hypothetical protein G6F62_015982 [Rhizopus arrhizus]|nr:hypothetical protein G6F62_015982 [Rhizopus arrhizus]